MPSSQNSLPPALGQAPVGGDCGLSIRCALLRSEPTAADAASGFSHLEEAVLPRLVAFVLPKTALLGDDALFVPPRRASVSLPRLLAMPLSEPANHFDLVLVDHPHKRGTPVCLGSVLLGIGVTVCSGCGELVRCGVPCPDVFCEPSCRGFRPSEVCFDPRDTNVSCEVSSHPFPEVSVPATRWSRGAQFGPLVNHVSAVRVHVEWALRALQGAYESSHL